MGISSEIAPTIVRSIHHVKLKTKIPDSTKFREIRGTDRRQEGVRTLNTVLLIFF